MNDLNILTSSQIKEAIDNVGDMVLFIEHLKSDQIERVVVHKPKNKDYLQYKDNRKKEFVSIVENSQQLVVILEYLNSRKEKIYFFGIWQMIRFIYLLKPRRIVKLNFYYQF